MTPAYLDTAIAIARDAGAVLAAEFAKGVVAEAKGRFDLVTAVDHRVEAAILSQLAAAFPSHAVLTEESGAHGREGRFRWFVDPLDGTKNFTRGYPAFTLSLALARDHELIAAVVLDPIRNELYTAERGAGAWRNGSRIRVSTACHLEHCLVATGFPSATRHQGANLELGPRVSMNTQGLRRTGSSALDLCYVASGRLDAFWDIGLRAWDIAAGVLLISEAGGRCTQLSGAPFALESGDLLADNGYVHEAFVRLFVESPAAELA